MPPPAPPPCCGRETQRPPPGLLLPPSCSITQCLFPADAGCGGGSSGRKGLSSSASPAIRATATLAIAGDNEPQCGGSSATDPQPEGPLGGGVPSTQEACRGCMTTLVAERAALIVKLQAACAAPDDVGCSFWRLAEEGESNRAEDCALGAVVSGIHPLAETLKCVASSSTAHLPCLPASSGGAVLTAAAVACRRMRNAAAAAERTPCSRLPSALSLSIRSLVLPPPAWRAAQPAGSWHMASTTRTA